MRATPPAAAAGTSKLQKILAQAGLGSRRDMEELVRAGRVTVNGQPATIGARVGRQDVIQVDGRTLGKTESHGPARVLLYYKPEGEIVRSASSVRSRDPLARSCWRPERLPQNAFLPFADRRLS